MNSACCLLVPIRYCQVIHRGYITCAKFSRYLSGIEPRDIIARSPALFSEPAYWRKNVSLFENILHSFSQNYLTKNVKKNLTDTV